MKIDSKIVKIMSYGPLHMSKYAEFRGEFDGDDENSSNLFRITVFDEILFEKWGGVYLPDVSPFI